MLAIVGVDDLQSELTISSRWVPLIISLLVIMLFLHNYTPKRKPKLEAEI